MDPLRPLIDAALAGDDVAVAELVAATQPPIWRLCSHLGSRADTEDLVQETYVRAMRSLSSYRGDAPVQMWLLAIARRVCADHIRRNQRDRRLVDRLTALAPAGRSGSEPGAHKSTSLGEAVEQRELLDTLDPERREAFVLTQLVGLKYAEAAAVIGCAIGTIRSRVARARVDLREALRRAEAS